LSTASAEAKRGPTWVPYRAWKAVERAAKAQFAPNVKLFKTDATKAHSLGLKGAHSSAWIVGAQVPIRPMPGIMPCMPRQTYFLVTKNKKGHWETTQLDGMGSYLSRVDALRENASVHVSVDMCLPGNACHGVEVANATRLQVTRGTALAFKNNSPTTQTVFLKGDRSTMPLWSPRAQANIRATVPPEGFCGTTMPRNIPVTFTQAYHLALGRGLSQ
jgi:hypothetical protein